MGTRQTGDELPLDIFYQIFLTLPVKTLNRFRCVCKQWSSLISQPRFQQDHYRHSQQTLLLIFIENNFDEVHKTNTLQLSTKNSHGASVKRFSKTVPQQIQDTTFAPILSCLGLVCITDYYSDEDSLSLMMCNPYTEELIYLPPPPIPAPSFHRCIGFGYAASSKEFKLVKFFTHGGTNYCHVFTLGTSHWREARTLDKRHPTILTISFDLATFLHGALHLLPSHPKYVHDGGCSLVAFDIESEEYRDVPLPKNYCTNCRGTDYLTELGGSLCLVGKRTVHVELWLLKDYNINRVWVKEYNIDISSLSRDRVSCFEILVMVDDGSIWLRFFTRSKNKFVLYNPQSRSVVRKIKSPWYCEAISYTESFLSSERRILLSI